MNTPYPELLERGYYYAAYYVEHHGWWLAVNKGKTMPASNHFREGFNFYLDTHKELANEHQQSSYQR